MWCLCAISLSPKSRRYVIIKALHRVNLQAYWSATNVWVWTCRKFKLEQSKSLVKSTASTVTNQPIEPNRRPLLLYLECAQQHKARDRDHDELSFWRTSFWLGSSPMESRTILKSKALTFNAPQTHKTPVFGTSQNHWASESELLVQLECP